MVLRFSQFRNTSPKGRIKNKMKKLTATQIETVKQALAQTEKMFAKESNRNAETRPQEMMELLAFWASHIKKLKMMLA